MSEEEDQEQIVQDEGPEFEFEETGDPERKLTIDELYDHAGFKLLSFNTTVAAGLSVFMYGNLIMFVQLLTFYLTCKGEITTTEDVAVKIVMVLGLILGLPLGGIISDRIGRAKTALIGSYVVLISWVLSAITVKLLYATMLLLGGGFAFLLPSAIVFAFENSSLHQHNKVTMIVFGEYILGEIFCVVLFDTLVELVGWHWITAIIAAPSIFLIIFFHVTTDSPRFLAISGRHHIAYEHLLMLHKSNSVPMMQGRLKSQEIPERGKCCGPCNLVNLRATILLLILFLVFSFCYYSTSYGVYRTLLQTGVCFTTKIVGYLTCETSRKSQLLKSLLGLVPEILGLIFAVLFCSAAGKKVSMLILSAVAGAAILANSICFQPGLVTIIELGIGRGFTFGALVLVMVYALEVYTTDKRCTAFSYLLVLYAIGIYLAGTLTVELSISASVIFIILGVVLFLALIPIWFLEKVGKVDVDENLDEQQPLTS